jgi:hypothetical protein
MLGAKEMILFGGKETVTSLPTSSLNLSEEAWDKEAQRKMRGDRIKKHLRIFLIEAEI